MSLKLDADIGNKNLFSQMSIEIIQLKEDLKRRETERIKIMLSHLNKDESRLKKCLDDVESFHRDMFFLPRSEEKPDDSKNRSDINRSEYSVTEPGSSVNEPEYSVNVPSSSMNNVVSPIVNAEESDCFVVRRVENPNSFENESSNDESSDSNDESSDSNDESSDSNDESSDSLDEQGFIKNKSPNSEDESDDEDYDTELAKKSLMNVLEDKEKEVTQLVLRLLYSFSTFQKGLQTAEKSISESNFSFPVGSNAAIKSLLQTLIESVLHMDKSLSSIYTKYSEIVQDLTKMVFDDKLFD